ncbi:MucR family transcriptional regulator [Aureimonas sp. Leaf454]|uniref:MucR family transcriptional regulator n=1 Tax=Aureimonas sp. Leaf454 TaxID=1736381 RepID=UPI000A7FE6C3|nr:MucR family transcriptional regulator [Aureimonas sp. Leaf454]
MINTENENQPVPIEHAATIVAAYVGNNHVASANLPALIESVFQALTALTAVEPKAVEPPPLVPAVPIKKSVTDDYIVCLEDGKSFKSLKRHLMTHYDLTPEAYRTKWKLPADYPMVAPNYAAARSALAKTMGLGRKAAPPEEAPADEAAPKRRAGRKAKEQDAA